MNPVLHDTSRDRDVSPDMFRAAMRRLTGGVSVITAGRGAEISGMTVSSVSSLCADPPALIVSVSRSASSLALMKSYGFFGSGFREDISWSSRKARRWQAFTHLEPVSILPLSASGRKNAESLRPAPEIFPFSGDCGRRLGSIPTAG
jgi:Flavin reductase like domain